MTAHTRAKGLSVKEESRSDARILIGAVILATCAMFLAGCSASPVTVNPDIENALLQAVTVPPELELAKERLVTDCMNKAGFQYAVDLQGMSTLSSPNLLGAAGLWESVDQARTEGYASSVEPAAAPSEQDAYLNSLSSSERSRYDRAMYGDPSKEAYYTSVDGVEVSSPDDGCLGEATSTIYGSGKDFLEFTSLYNESREPIVNRNPADLPGVTEVMGKYGSCMRDAGYDTGSLSETATLAERLFGASRTATDPPTRDEQAMAVTDAGCQEKSDLRGVLNRAYVAASTEWINHNQDKLLRLVDQKNSALARAKAVIER